jgi:hypothetical protein
MGKTKGIQFVGEAAPTGLFNIRQTQLGFGNWTDMKGVAICCFHSMLSLDYDQ